jgi:uncharacterized protein (TIGR02001 family)
MSGLEMKSSSKLFLGAVSLTGVVAAAPPTVAQDAPQWALTGYVAATSDYRFRGISLNQRNFAAQGSLNVTGPDGFYVGAWASQVDFTPGPGNDPQVELDIYGGKHTDLWGIDWNFEPYYYSYPSERGGHDTGYFEIQNQFTKAFGPLTLSGTWAWSDNLWAWSNNPAIKGGTGNALYGNAAYTIFDWLSVSGNLGHQWAQNAKDAGSSDYTWADIGATLTWKSFALDLRYSGTDLGNVQCSAFYMATAHACAGNFAATLTYNINLLP